MSPSHPATRTLLPRPNLQGPLRRTRRGPGPVPLPCRPTPPRTARLRAPRDGRRLHRDRQPGPPAPYEETHRDMVWTAAPPGQPGNRGPRPLEAQSSRDAGLTVRMVPLRPAASTGTGRHRRCSDSLPTPATNPSVPGGGPCSPCPAPTATHFEEGALLDIHDCEVPELPVDDHPLPPESLVTGMRPGKRQGMPAGPCTYPMTNLTRGCSCGDAAGPLVTGTDTRSERGEWPGPISQGGSARHETHRLTRNNLPSRASDDARRSSRFTFGQGVPTSDQPQGPTTGPQRKNTHPGPQRRSGHLGPGCRT